MKKLFIINDTDPKHFFKTLVKSVCKQQMKLRLIQYTSTLTCPHNAILKSLIQNNIFLQWPRGEGALKRKKLFYGGFSYVFFFSILLVRVEA